MRAVCHSSPILRVLKLNYSFSSSDPNSLESLALLRLFVVKNDFIALETRAYSSSPLSRRLLASLNLTQPVPPPQAVDQVDFMALSFASMTLHEFML